MKKIVRLRQNWPLDKCVLVFYALAESIIICLHFSMLTFTIASCNTMSQIMCMSKHSSKGGTKKNLCGTNLCDHCLTHISRVNKTHAYFFFVFMVYSLWYIALVKLRGTGVAWWKGCHKCYQEYDEVEREYHVVCILVINTIEKVT